MSDARTKLASRARSLAPIEQLKLVRVTMVVAFAIVGVKIIAMSKDIATASTFGTSDAADAFLIASVLPSFLSGLVAGSVEAALIPMFIEVKMRDGAGAAHRLLGTITLATAGLLLSLSALLAIAGKTLLPLVGSGFTPEKTLLTSNLMLVLLPVILLSGITTIWTSILNANGEVAIAAISTVSLPCVSAVALLFASRIDAYALVIGVVAGYIVQLGLLAWVLHQTGVPVLPSWGGVSPEVRIVFRQFTPMVVASLLLTTAPLIDQTMLAGLDSGSVSQFYYGTKIVSVVAGIGSLAVGTAVLPYFSRLVVANNWIAIRQTLKLYGGAILLATIPVTAILIVESREIVRVLYERGEFTAQSAHAASQVQIWSAIQIPFYTLGMLLVRLVSSLRANRILMWGTGISFFVNFTGDYLLRAVMGAPGIALATTLVYVASLCFLAVMLRRELIRRESA